MDLILAVSVWVLGYTVTKSRISSYQCDNMPPVSLPSSNPSKVAGNVWQKQKKKGKGKNKVEDATATDEAGNTQIDDGDDLIEVDEEGDGAREVRPRAREEGRVVQDHREGPPRPVLLRRRGEVGEQLVPAEDLRVVPQ